MQAVEKRKRRGRAVYIAIVLTFLYLPMLMVALFSFNPSKTAGVMTGFTLEWYRELFTDKEIAKTLANSLKLAALSVGTAAVIGTAGAVALARKRMRLQGMMEGMAMLPAMVPMPCPMSAGRSSDHTLASMEPPTKYPMADGMPIATESSRLMPTALLGEKPSSMRI